MPIYDIAMICHLTDSVTQVLYADDSRTRGRFSSLHQWWDLLCKLGPGLGYFPNASKTWLVVKDRCHSEAMVTFAGTDVKLTSDG